jgi:hypothetical protein
MLIREVHFTSQELKEASGADINTGGSVTTYTLLAVEPDMWRCIDLETDKLQTLLDRLHDWLFSSQR